MIEGLGPSFAARHLMASATNGIDYLLDCVDHQLWLLHLDRMAAICSADVFRAEKFCETILSG